MALPDHAPTERYPQLTVLGPDGDLLPGAAVPAGLGDDALLGLYRHLVHTRAHDVALTNLQRQGQLSTYPPCAGQEAAQVGTASVLTPGDWVFPSYRELGVAVVRGVPLTAIGHAWRGTWFSDWDPRALRFGALSVPVGTNGLHAVGVAMGAARRRERLVVAAYFGDGACSEGDVHEAFNLASVFALPCVFVIQNNGWAISTPTTRQYAAPTLAQRAEAYAMAAWRCDGNDVLASHAAMTHAVQWARNGHGPAIVEAVTYRMGPHTTADDPSRYRSDDEVAAWAGRDPILRFEAFLRRRGLLDNARVAAVAGEAALAVATLRAALVDAPAGDPLEVFDHVYTARTPALDVQRAAMAAELDAWNEAGR